MRSASPDLSVIVVTHDDGPATARCLAAAKREADARDLRSEFVVVDNASTDGGPEALTAVFPALRLVRNAENRGFGAAVNQGFIASEGRRVLLLNPDAELADGALGPLWDALDDDATALAAPRLVLPDGSDQESPRRFYDLAGVLARRTPFGRTSAGRVAAARHVMSATETRDDVDWVTGAAMLLKREAVAEHGPFDERFFLYFEDVDLCRRLHAGGRKVAFRADAAASHRFGGASRRQVPWNRPFRAHVASGIRYALRWHRGWWAGRWWRAAATRVAAFGVRFGILAAVAGVLLPASVLPAAAGALLTSGTRSVALGRAPRPTLGATSVGIALAAVIVAAWVGFTPALAAWVATSVALLHVVRLFPVPRVRRSVILAGDAASAVVVARALREHPHERIDVLGFAPRDPLGVGGPTPRLPDWTRIAQIAEDQRCDGVLLAGSPEDLARMAGGVADLRAAGVPCTFALTGSNELLQADDADRLAGLPVLSLGPGADAPALARVEFAVQRLAALIGLVVLILPAIPLLGLLAARFGRPVTSVPRVGRDGAPFAMLRLRSHGENDDGGRLGAVLRRLHLDELPQLLHVVRGEMSLVGPRPVDPDTAARLEPWERARFRVRPGITGIWQLDRLHRWRLEEMVASDLLYLLRWSPRLDARLLAETLFGRRT